MTDIQLMPHQEDGVVFLGERDVALLHWDQGTGKTYAAVRACDRAQLLNEEEGMPPLPILVICPAVARRNWRREFLKAQTRDRQIIVMEKGRTPIASSGVVIVSYDLAHRPEVWAELMKRDYDALILDEVQYIKNPKALRTQAVFGRRRHYPSGLISKAYQCWALSGTPAPNHIGELFPWLKATHPERVPAGYNQFIRMYCRVEETPWGPKVVGNNKDQVRRLMNNIGDDVSRIHKADVLPDLPPIRFSPVEVSGDQTAAQVRDLEDQYRADLEQLLENIQGRAPEPAAHLTTLRRITEMAKIGDLLSTLSAELTDHAIEKVVVFANFIDSIDAIAAGLTEYGTAVVHGAIMPKNRQLAIDRFQNDPECRVFVGQTIAAGTAITLHADGACQDVVMVSADWVPGNNAQAIARVHRIGQPGSVTARFLHLANSIDEVVIDTLMKKTANLCSAFQEERKHHAA